MSDYGIDGSFDLDEEAFAQVDAVIERHTFAATQRAKEDDDHVDKKRRMAAPAVQKQVNGNARRAPDGESIFDPRSAA